MMKHFSKIVIVAVAMITVFAVVGGKSGTHRGAASGIHDPVAGANEGGAQAGIQCRPVLTYQQECAYVNSCGYAGCQYVYQCQSVPVVQTVCTYVPCEYKAVQHCDESGCHYAQEYECHYE